LTKKSKKHPDRKINRTWHCRYAFLQAALEEGLELALRDGLGKQWCGIIHAFDRNTLLFGGRNTEKNPPRLFLNSNISTLAPQDAGTIINTNPLVVADDSPGIITRH